MYRVIWEVAIWRRDKKVSPAFLCGSTPANTGQLPNAISMLGQRRRLWLSVETAQYTADPGLD